MAASVPEVFWLILAFLALLGLAFYGKEVYNKLRDCCRVEQREEANVPPNPENEADGGGADANQEPREVAQDIQGNEIQQVTENETLQNTGSDNIDGTEVENGANCPPETVDGETGEDHETGEDCGTDKDCKTGEDCATGEDHKGANQQKVNITITTSESLNDPSAECADNAQPNGNPSNVPEQTMAEVDRNEPMTEGINIEWKEVVHRLEGDLGTGEDTEKIESDAKYLPEAQSNQQDDIQQQDMKCMLAQPESLGGLQDVSSPTGTRSRLIIDDVETQDNDPNIEEPSADLVKNSEDEETQL